jgi:hypothetical protein
MRKRRPHVATLDEVTITRKGESAIIEFTDPAVASTHLRIGAAMCRLSDQQILDEFNHLLACEEEDAAQYHHVAIEVPPGQPQIRYFAPGGQWTPRGAVLRCVVDDSGPDGEAVIHIDDQELTLPEFGRLLCTYSGWGMRITFMPEDALETEPTIEVCEPDDDP